MIQLLLNFDIAATTLSGLSFGITSSASPNLLTQALSRRMNLALQTSKEDNASLATLYANAFTVQPSRLPYRPPQTLKPLVDGPQIAIVVGPPGEEIFTDKYGRVKVHFPWDRHKDPKAEDSSCWIRVSMNWGGGKWGHVALPRIGHEVIVDFLEGDPDQPIIIGRTYHEKNMLPYELPDHKTRMTIQSKTHKGDGFNELRFEDEKNQEEVFIHAQKDMNEKIENNASRRVNVNLVESIGHNHGTEIANEQTTVVGGTYKLFVGPKNKIETVGHTSQETVIHNKTSTIKKRYMIDVGTEFTLTAQDKITFQCGDSLIVMTSDGSISIKGKRNTIQFEQIVSILSNIVKVN